MKYIRNLLPLLYLLIITSPAMSEVRFGIMGGRTEYKLHLDKQDTQETKFSDKKGLAVGAVLDLGINRYFDLSFEPMYLKKGAEKEFQDMEIGLIKSSITTSHFEMPVLLKLSLNKYGINPYLVGGATASYLLDAKEEFGNEYLEYGFENEVDIKDDFTSTDYGYLYGGGLSIPIGNSTLFVEGRYVNGLADINNIEGSTTEIMTEGWQFLAGISFQLGGGNADIMKQDAGGNDDDEDPRDTPKPHVYGEEIDGKVRCIPEFIVPANPCRFDTKPVNSYMGKICYIVFPGSKWETTSPVPKIREAQELYASYCIYLNFEEKKVSRKVKRKMELWYKIWLDSLRNSIIPKGHEKGIRKEIKAKNPNFTQQELDEAVEKRIESKLYSSTMPDSLHEDFRQKMLGLQQTCYRGCKGTLVVFMDQYICKNPRPTRVSACQRDFNQIGIVFLDNGSKNILAHELVHLLGKEKPDIPGGVTWGHHEICREEVNYCTRGKWWNTYQFGDYLTYENYFEIIKNKAGVKLFKRIK